MPQWLTNWLLQMNSVTKWIRWASILGLRNGLNSAQLVQSGAVTNVLDMCKRCLSLEGQNQDMRSGFPMQKNNKNIVGASHILVHGLNMLTAVLRSLPGRLRPPLKSHFLRDVVRVAVKALQVSNLNNEEERRSEENACQKKPWQIRSSATTFPDPNLYFSTTTTTNSNQWITSKRTKVRSLIIVKSIVLVQPLRSLGLL